MRRGVRKTVLQAGMTVTVDGFRTKDSSNNGYCFHRDVPGRTQRIHRRSLTTRTTSKN